MELLWLYLTLIATIARGLNSVVLKVFTQKESKQELVIIYESLFTTLFAGIFYILFSKSELIVPTGFTLLLILSVGLVVALSRKLVLQSLSHLSASAYFILVRIFSSFFVVIFSMIFLQEFLTLTQWIGIFFGIVVFLLLYDTKDKVKKSANIKLGFLFLFLVVLCFSYVNPIHKLIMSEIDIYLYLFYFMLSTLFFSTILFLKPVKNEILNTSKNLKIMGLALSSSFLLVVSITFLFQAYLLQEVAIVYKIFSFELFIPIIFSIIVYKEKITIRKVGAFIGTILTILFFV